MGSQVSMVRKYCVITELTSSPFALRISRTCAAMSVSKPAAGVERPGENDAKKLDEACSSEIERLLPVEDPGLAAFRGVEEASSFRIGGPV